jgi:hypothetical protein
MPLTVETALVVAVLIVFTAAFIAGAMIPNG